MRRVVSAKRWDCLAQRFYFQEGGFMRIIAVLVVSVMLFGVVQSLPVWAGVNDFGVIGVLPHVAGAVF